MLIDGQPSRIVGVLPDAVAQAGFTADVWEPHTLFADWDTRRAASGAGSWFVIGRLRAGAAIEPAQRELEAILARTDPPPAGAAGTRGIRIVTLGEQVTGPRSRAVVWLLTGAALLVWLVAAVNVAGLTLARGVARLPQLAIRVALGASRARLARSLLAESLTLAGSAGIVGLAVALAATRAIRVFGPAYVARLEDVRLDLRVFASAVAVSAVTGLLIGLTPIVAAWRRDLRVTGVDGGRRATSGAATRLRRLFVVGQCAAAIVLLAGAGLLLRSWWNVSRVDPGFRTEGVVSLNVAPPADLPEAQRADFYDAVLDRVSRVPGVERAGISSELFVGNVGQQLVTAEGSERAGAQPLALRRDEIAGGVFDALGTPLRGGRTFTAADGRGAARVAIVNAAMAGRLWPGRDAVGRRFALGPPVADARLVHRRRRRRRHAPPGSRDRAGAADVRAGGAGAVATGDPRRAHVAGRSAVPRGRAARRGTRRRAERRGLPGDTGRRSARGGRCRTARPDRAAARLRGRGLPALEHRPLRADSGTRS